MRNRDTLRVGGRRLSRVNTDLAHTILSIVSNGGGGATVTTAVPHGLTDATEVIITGGSEAQYFSQYAAASCTTFTFDIDVHYGTATGGYWKLA